jgi:TonB-dependent receptor
MTALAALFAASLPAQEAGFGAVSGRVTDATTGLALGGARVVVAGTPLETFTSPSGNYTLTQVPAGERTVVVAYVGYPDVQGTVTVAAGGSARLDLTPGAVALGAFVIEGSLVGSARAINEQRAAATLTNLVASDEIGRFPDQNAAESLSRLPGVSVYRDQGEGRFINVRGINYTLGNVTLDGSGLASPESGQRAIALDVVPSDSLGALEVNKVPTPDMTAEGLGGNVNLRSKSPFDGESRSAKLSAQTIYSAHTRDFGYKLNGEYSSVSADGRVGFLVGFSQQERDFGSYNYETDRWTALNPPDLEEATQPFFSPVELQFRDYTINRERTGLNAALEFRPDGVTRIWVRGTYNDFSDVEDRQTFFVPVSDDNVNAITRLDNTSGLVEGARRFSRRARDRAKLQDLLAFMAGAETVRGRWTLDAQAGRSRGVEDKDETQARFRRSTRDTAFRYEVNGYNISVEQLNSPPAGAFGNPAAYNQFQRFDVESDDARETETNVRFNARYELDTIRPAYLKAGAAFRSKEKRRDEGIYEFADNGSGRAFANYTSTFSRYPYGPSVVRIDTPRVVGFFEQNPGLFELDFADELGNDYTVDEDVLAAYAMAGATFGRLQVIAGVRVEDTDVKTNGNVVDEDLELVERGSGGGGYTDVLPGLHFRYNLSQDLVLRASYSTSIVRPAFGELAFGRAIDSENFEITERNPDLAALNSRNLDVSLEYYLPSLGLFSVAAFHKDIKDFTFLTNAGTRALGGNTYDVFTYRNGSEGEIYGLELAHQQQLRFLPAPFDGLGVQSNLTLSRSEADYGALGTFDFVGQSELLGNVALTYEKGRFLGRLAVNFRSERLREDEDISFEDTLIYVDDSVQVDLTLAYKLRKGAELFAEIVNLTNEPFRVYSAGGPRNQPKLFQQFEEYDVSVYAGVRWKL